MTVLHDVHNAEIRWPFGRGPVLVWGRQEDEVDPFPGYAHDDTLVMAALAACSRDAPIAHGVTVHLTDRESLSRTNGWTNYETWWEGEGDDRVAAWRHHIVLSGKRIPIHPAVTRYLIPHEYAHALWTEHGAQRGDWDRERLAAEYAELRGVSNHLATGGRWHDAVEEVAACDFRVLIMEAECDYWPHPGIPPPHGNDDVEIWWRGLIDEIRPPDSEGTER